MRPSETLKLQDRRYDLYTELISIETQLSQADPAWAGRNYLSSREQRLNALFNEIRSQTK